jgi:peptide/nickel transport system permease protein
MVRFLLRRLLLALVVLLIASSATFCFFASEYQPLKAEPLSHAYWEWLRGLPTGRSLSHSELSGPLLPVVAPAVGHTLALLALTLVFVLAFALAFGCLSAASRGSALDAVLRAASYLAWSVPAFLVALVLQQSLGKYAGGYGLGWFPNGGWPGTCPFGLGIDPKTLRCPGSGFGLSRIANVLYYLTVPALALALGFIGLHSRYLRSSLVDALDAPYVTVARAKGLPERVVVLRHALRNSLVTFAPAILTDFGAIFGASLAVDWVFQLNGIGTLFIGVLNVNSTSASIDAYAAELLLVIGGVCVLGASILSELLVGFLDPRVRLE